MELKFFDTMAIPSNADFRTKLVSYYNVRLCLTSEYGTNDV